MGVYSKSIENIAFQSQSIRILRCMSMQAQCFLLPEGDAAAMRSLTLVDLRAPVASVRASQVQRTHGVVLQLRCQRPASMAMQFSE